jgi:glycosyltransferase involved in cell wall biosynthesis
MTRVVIDARLAGHSGIGVYLEQMLPRVVPRLAPWRPRVLSRSDTMPEWAQRLERFADVSAWNAPPLGAANLWSAPPSIAADDLLWTPHFNVPLLRRGPLAVTLHDLMPISAPKLAGRGRSLPVRMWMRAIRRHGEAVFCDSEFTQREAVARAALDPSRIIVAPLGVNPLWHSAAAKAATKEATRDSLAPTIIFVGLLKPHKNVTRLVQAFDRIKAKIPHRLLLVARHTGVRSIDHEALRWIRRLGERVMLIENLALDDLIAAVQAAEFAALPSLHEGFGLPALEAMSAGTPVLASRAGALAEVCGDAAAYCDPLSVDDIARGLLELASNPALRARLSASGLLRSAAFSWERCAATTGDALVHVLARLSSRRQR